MVSNVILFFWYLDSILERWHEKWLVLVPILSIADPEFPMQKLKDIQFSHNARHSPCKYKAIRIPPKIAFLKKASHNRMVETSKLMNE